MINSFSNRKRSIERWAVAYQEINICIKSHIHMAGGGINFRLKSMPFVCGVLCTLRRNEVNVDLLFTFDIYMLSIEDKMYFIFIFICICLWLSFIYWMFRDNLLIASVRGQWSFFVYFGFILLILLLFVCRLKVNLIRNIWIIKVF